MKKALIPAVILGIGMLMLTCSGSDLIPPTPPPPGPGPGTGGPILNLTDEQRIAVLNECGTFADALGDLKLDATQQLLVTYLKSRGEFADADAENGNVWARFHDGRLAMFIPDWLSKDPDGGRLPTRDISGGRNDTESAGRIGVPEGKKVMLFHGLGNAFADSRPYLSEIFSKSHTKYNVQSKDATIQNLESAKDVDVFYFDTHGGGGSVLEMNSPLSMFSLWTSDSVSAEREARYRSALDNKELTYMRALEDRGIFNRPINEWHYAISEKFVYAHMTFTENSLLYIDACNGLTTMASSFQQVMMARAMNSTTTYIGWTGATDDDTGLPTSRFIFDRLLGAPVYMLEAPPQRPFDLGPIMPELFKYNLGVSSYGGKLAFESSVEGEIMLAPSIKYILMDEYNSMMRIEGMFGDDSRNDRKVLVGGMSVPIENWSANRIFCHLPVTGAGSSGDVVVVVNDHESNKVPLSEWTIPLHIIKDDFGVKTDVQLNLKIRADVHMYRPLPEQVPTTDRPEMIQPPPGSLGFPFSHASTGTYTVGGQRSAQCVKNGCTMRDTESFLARHGPLPYTFRQPALGFEAFYKWSVDMKKIEVHVVVNLPDMGMEMETYTFCEKGDPITTTFSGNTVLGIQTTKPLEFKLDANYDIQVGHVDDMENIPWGRCGLPGYFKFSATWPKVTPKSGPKPDTAARYATGD